MTTRNHIPIYRYKTSMVGRVMLVDRKLEKSIATCEMVSSLHEEPRQEGWDESGQHSAPENQKRHPIIREERVYDGRAQLERKQRHEISVGMKG
jgi:hypothetical protein